MNNTNRFKKIIFVPYLCSTEKTKHITDNNVCFLVIYQHQISQDPGDSQGCCYRKSRKYVLHNRFLFGATKITSCFFSKFLWDISQHLISLNFDSLIYCFDPKLHRLSNNKGNNIWAVICLFFSTSKNIFPFSIDTKKRIGKLAFPCSHPFPHMQTQPICQDVYIRTTEQKTQL